MAALFRTFLVNRIPKGSMFGRFRQRSATCVLSVALIVICYTLYRNKYHMAIQTYFLPGKYVHLTSPLRFPQVINISTNATQNQTTGVKEETITKPWPIYVKVENLNIYLFSAFIREAMVKPEWIQIALNTWEHQTLEKTSLKCCYLYEDNSMDTHPVTKTARFLNIAILRATQYECPIPRPRNTTYLVSLTRTTSNCSRNRDTYVFPERPMDVVYRPNKDYSSEESFHSVTTGTGNDYTVAVCIKIAYGNLRPEFTIEWTEFYRKMGIDLVFGFTNNLNPETERIFDYYRSIGFLRTLPFDYPEKDNPRRRLGEKNNDAWNDDYIAIIDCQERLKKYTYVGRIDMDEFIVPYEQPDIVSLLKRLEKDQPNAGQFEMTPMFHVLDWGKSATDKDAAIAQYINHTEPIQNFLVKFFYSTNRIVPWTLWNHGVKMIPPYTLYHVPTSIAAISHFRNCRREWTNGRCFTLKRLSDTRLQKHVDNHFISQVQKVRAHVGNITF